MGRTAVLVFGACALIAAAAAPTWLVAADAPAAAPGAAYDPAIDYRKGLEALRFGRVDRAEAAAMTILGAQSQYPPGRQLLGLVKIKRGDLAGAVSEFDKALDRDPQFIPAREERAVALARLGQPDKARVDLDALKTRAAACARACSPELRKAVSRVEAALAAARPPPGFERRGLREIARGAVAG